MDSFDEICKLFPDLDGISLIYESKFDPARCVYFYNGKIIKSRKIDKDVSSQLRQNDLKEEFEILKLCSGIKGVPENPHYCNNGRFELLFIDYLFGTQLINLKLTFDVLIKIIPKLIRILTRLSEKGICHNDIVPRNILVSENISISLIDFDQATVTTPAKAFAGNFLGINIGNSKVNYSFSTIIKHYIKQKFPTLSVRIKKILGRADDNEKTKLPEIKKYAKPELLSMLNAWQIAQESNASAPGVNIAYYGFDFMEYHFPGERPWADRWNVLKNISDFSGKTIVELGCNMGLLSTFLLKEAKAKKCIAVDGDKKILRSAEIISNVFQVKPEYYHIDFDSKEDWESKLIQYKPDIVFALNVLNWVNDKERFLKFLAKSPEVIFEGHDLPEIEKSRFLKLGFKNIEEIGYSERKRIILRCRK
jgi:tRNA A-37 threonylcarbamoyl transferase component Bud32/2-polyprenyl-3-methyl-5-hydroxy-6-metoxy-1,4-benzoquinol methylase